MSIIRPTDELGTLSSSRISLKLLTVVSVSWTDTDHDQFPANWRTRPSQHIIPDEGLGGHEQHPGSWHRIQRPTIRSPRTPHRGRPWNLFGPPRQASQVTERCGRQGGTGSTRDFIALLIDNYQMTSASTLGNPLSSCALLRLTFPRRMSLRDRFLDVPNARRLRPSIALILSYTQLQS